MSFEEVIKYLWCDLMSNNISEICLFLSCYLSLKDTWHQLVFLLLNVPFRHDIFYKNLISKIAALVKKIGNSQIIIYAEKMSRKKSRDKYEC